MNIHQKKRIFFFTQAITILSLFTYSVCDEKVKRSGKDRLSQSRLLLRKTWLTTEQLRTLFTCITSEKLGEED